jgi:hypothetical protein
MASTFSLASIRPRSSESSPQASRKNVARSPGASARAWSRIRCSWFMEDSSGMIDPFARKLALINNIPYCYAIQY